MEKLEDIKEQLVWGDYKIIRQMTGVALPTINAMMQKNRSINTPSGEKVLKAAKQIIEARHNLLNPPAPDDLPESEGGLPIPFTE